MRLRDELKACGCKMEEDAFRDLVADIFAEMYRDMTDEMLTRDPIEAMTFCGAVRYRAKCRVIPFPVILGTLQNLRKDGELAA